MGTRARPGSPAPRGGSPPPPRLARPASDALDAETAVAFGPLPWTGPGAELASGLALAVIADHEGAHFDARVADCRRTADEGRTVSLYGLMRGASWRGSRREDLCARGPLPAYLALLTLSGYARRCPLGGPAAWFRGYGVVAYFGRAAYSVALDAPEKSSSLPLTVGHEWPTVYP